MIFEGYPERQVEHFMERLDKLRLENAKAWDEWKCRRDGQAGSDGDSQSEE